MSRAPAPRRGPRLTLWLSADERLAVRDLPGRRRLAAWIRAALGARRGWFALSLRLAGRSEARALNRRFRGRDYAPNVLAFPAAPGPARPRPLGDLLLCLPVARAEARAQGKPYAHHLAHLLIHGTLHLLGHDHEAPAEAARMEARERRLLARFGIPDPYASGTPRRSRRSSSSR